MAFAVRSWPDWPLPLRVFDWATGALRAVACARGSSVFAVWCWPDWPLPVVNWPTRSRRAWAWAPNCSLEEAISSLPAADCSVTWEMPWMALETSSELLACWTVAVAISPILPAVASTPADDLLQRLLGLLAELGPLLDPAAQIP